MVYRYTSWCEYLQRGKDDKLLFTALKLAVMVTMRPSEEVEQYTKERLITHMYGYKEVGSVVTVLC